VKILLINPPRFNELSGNNPAIIESERGFNPPLGLLYIASYLLAHSKHEVCVLDSQVEELDYLQLETRIKEINPDIVGITAMSLTMLDVLETIKIVRGIKKDTKIILGGPHVNIYPEETLQLTKADVIVLGEGEKTFTDIIPFLDNKQMLKQIKGLVFYYDGAIYNTGLAPFIENLDALPFPARHLTPYKKYSSLLAHKGLVTSMITSRGCPFVCTFCNRPHLGKLFRARSPENVVDEMEACSKMGISEFLIYDDNFNIDGQRVMLICDEIIKRHLDVTWSVRAHVNTVTKNMLEVMKRAGCQAIHYGIESGNERLLKIIKKNITKERVCEVFKMTKKIGIKTLAYFMIGLPTETKEDIEETFSFMREVNPDYVHLTTLVLFPATEIYQDALGRGLIEQDVWRNFALNPTKEFVPPRWKGYFSNQELESFLVKGYKAFYLRPQYIARRLLNISDYSQFIKEAKAGIKVLGM